MFASLTAEDKVELQGLQIGAVKENLDPVRFDRRMAIAKKVASNVVANDPAMSKWAKEFYQTTCPLWQFYVTEINTLVVNVVDKNDLCVVDRWTNEHATLIQETIDAPNTFFDPMGFILAMTRSVQMK